MGISMIIIQMAGGLGNQLQQYAVYRQYVRMGVEARLDTSWFTDGENQEKVLAGRELELAYFDRLLYETCTREEKEELIGSDGLFGKLRRKFAKDSIHWFRESQIYHPEIWGYRDMYLSGYFACERYYSDILFDLRERLQFPASSNPSNIETAEQMNRQNSVSVHIRRGDYLEEANQAMFGGICTEAYYESAMGLCREQFPDCHFYLFSDDSAYVREHYKGEEYTVIDWNHGRDSFYDMWLMSQCRHNICANSTFSFWGARLNGKEDKLMIRPTIHKNTQVFEKEKMMELWPGWLFVDPQGICYGK